MEMTLYDLNAQAILQMEQEPDDSMESTLFTFLIEKYDTTKHFLLLCRDISYYTIFEKSSEVYYGEDFNLLNELKECVEPYGDIKTLYITDNGTIELWTVNKFDDILCFLLFPCDDWVVNIPW